MEVSFGLLAIRIVYSAALVYFLSKFLRWLINYIKLVRIINKIYSPVMMLPFIGNAHQLKPGAGLFEQMLEFKRIYKGYINRLWIGTQPVIIIQKAEYVEVISFSCDVNYKKF